jgi:hypothetical protein
MRKKIVGIGCLILFFSAILLNSNLYAYGRKYQEVKSDKAYRWTIEDKFFKKAGFLMRNQEEIGLTEEQIKDIKILKMDIKKALIMKKAEIEVKAIDIKSMLWQDEINIKKINKLIDEKYEIKKGKTKLLVKAYTDIKGMLTAEQKIAMKVVWEKKCFKK